ncbi:MAG: hypothetical protein PSY14_06715 [bacterium]|nr:hypothetical protein [bacterium]
MTGLVNMIGQFGFGRGVFPDANGIIWDTPATDGISGLLAHGLNLGSSFSDMFAGQLEGLGHTLDARQKSSSLEMQAREQELQAQQELIKGKQDANDVLDNLVQTIAQQKLTFAANGIDPNFGTPVSTYEATKEIAGRQMSVTRENATMNALSRRRQAAAFRAEGANTVSNAKWQSAGSVFQGTVRAGGTYADEAMRRINRG